MKNQNKTYIVYFCSRYYPFEGNRRRKIIAPSKKWIRDNWHGIMGTDEYRLIKSEEVK